MALGIIISISIITALGIAVLENPQVQQWLEEQRRNLAELLRTIGPDLDPQSRREAEAFAFEGRTPSNDEAIRREMQASRDAAAVATGRSAVPPSNTVRRIPVRGPEDDEAAEERRRLGREYLARRNRDMLELQEKRGIITSPTTEAPPMSPTSFDAMVDKEGKLRSSDAALPTPPQAEPEAKPQEMSEVEMPIHVGETSSPSIAASGWQMGAALANPFGDEFEMERSITPKPPVPPKIKLEKRPQPTPEAVEEQQVPETRQEELSYEEQLAIALSLSESEGSKPSATVRRGTQQEYDDDLRAAIEASLRDMDGQQAAHAVANAAPDTPRIAPSQQQPLVDLTPDPPTSAPQDLPPGDWRSLFDHAVWTEEQKTADPPVSVPTPAVTADEDDLYSVTPQLTRARLAVHDTAQGSSGSSSPKKPYDPVHEAASSQQQQQPQPLDASFYSAQSRSTSPPKSHTVSHGSLIDVSEATPSVAEEQSAASRSRASSFAFSNASGSEAFASFPGTSREQTPSQQTASAARSEFSDVEVIDVVEDSDVDMLSEEGDGVATPDSWTEVGSQDGDSEISREDAPVLTH